MVSHYFNPQVKERSPAAEMEYASIEGNDIHTATLVQASSAPPLLIFNGFGANLEMLFPLMNTFTGRSVLTFDVPGVGGSSTPLLPLRMRGHADIASKVLDHFDLEKVDVLGFSWGGFLAQEFAYRHRERCRRLVLVATSPGSLMVPGMESVVQLASSPTVLLDFADISKRRNLHERDLDPEEKALLDEYYTLVRPGQSTLGHFYQAYACLGWTSAHWLHKLTPPTLILAGTRDPLVPIVNARYMALQIPDNQLIEIDSGHLFLFLLKEKIVKVIENFLSP